MRAAWLALILLGAALAGCLGGSTDEDIDPTAATGPGGFSDTAVFPGEYKDDEPHSLVLEDGPFDVLSAEPIALESELDGEKIETAVIRPDVPEGTQVPVIAFASPYLYPLHATDLLELRPRLTDNFVEHGYAVAFVSVRGFSDSGGCSDLMGPNERADLDQAITWLGTQDWSNGNVGMLGVSYDGSTPWEVAAAGNPHLKTIVPISGINDIYDLIFPNGTSEFRGSALFNGFYYAYIAFGWPDRAPERTAKSVLCPEAWQGFHASAHAAVIGERDPLGFWEERNSRPGVEENYQGSIFMVHGLQDWNVDPHHAYPWTNQLEDQGLTVKHLLGQWGHAWPDVDYLPDDQRRLDFAEILLHWFDRELKEATTVDVGPKVQVQDSTGQWRSDESWPPERATPATLYLGPGDALTWEPADGSESVPVAPEPLSLACWQPLGLRTPDCGVTAEPGPAEQAASDALCSGCAVFESDALDAELRFAGLPPLHVTVTPTGPTGHLAAFLYYQEGDELHRLGWTQMDLRFADGDETMDPITPGEPIVARMQLGPLDAVVPAGASLVLVLHQGAQDDHAPLVPPAPVMLEVGGEQSTLGLDTFTVDAGQFFEPPTGE